MLANMDRPPAAIGPMPRWAIAVVMMVGAWFLATHLLHAFTEAINWDEFALLERADRKLRLGDFAGGGRPGLVTTALMPFVSDCIDSVRSVVHARLLWQLMTLAYLVGVYFLVRRWFVHAGRTHEGQMQGLLAVALLAFLPAFVTWSVQVRTDQPAGSPRRSGVALLMLSRATAGRHWVAPLFCGGIAVHAEGPVRNRPVRTCSSQPLLPQESGPFQLQLVPNWS